MYLRMGIIGGDLCAFVEKNMIFSQFILLICAPKSSAYAWLVFQLSRLRCN